MKKIPMSFPNILGYTPKWASKVIAYMTFAFVLNGACQMYDLYNLPMGIQHKIDGVYAIGNLILLSFGVKKEEEKIEEAKPE